MNWLNYLEDYQLKELKGQIGNTFSVNCSPTGYGKLIRVNKGSSVFKSVIGEFTNKPDRKNKGKMFTEPNMIAYNIIG